MTKKQHTPFFIDKFAIETHRLLGDRIYGTDIDMLEFTYHDGKPKFVAMVDYKHGNIQQVNSKAESLQVQIQLANTLQIGFFLCVTYLEAELFPTPMYYVVPINTIAKIKLSGYTYDGEGVWMSLQQYSKFQHNLRDIMWNPYEHNVEAKKSLNELSDVVVKYPLPQFNLK